MKKQGWLLLFLSAVLYALPFLYSAALWWLIFIFLVPSLYITRTENLSFVHGYVWAIVVFTLHLHVGISVVANLAGHWWWIGILMGMGMVLCQALAPAILFWCTTMMVHFLLVRSSIIRLLLWTAALALFIFWTDQYCMRIFGDNGYPFMHPLLPLAQHPSLLQFLPIVGKQLLLLFFLLVPVSIVIVLWYKSYASILLCIISFMPWIWWGMHQPKHENQPDWYKKIGSLPCMIRAHTPRGVLRILVQHLKKLTAIYPEVSIIIMPESALDKVENETLNKLHESHMEKQLHLIFGACSCENGNYYNSLYWIHNGSLQARFDKKHTMLMTECLADWMNVDWLRKIYFKDGISMTRSCNERKSLHISESIAFVPYICSELFFNEYPDDCHPDTPIIVIINDTLLIDSYMQELPLLLAQCKAIQWRRNIVYVSYRVSVFIDKRGMIKMINE